MTDALKDGDLHEWTFEAISADDVVRLAAGPLAGLVPHGFTYTSATCRLCVVVSGSTLGLLPRLRGRQAQPPRLMERDAGGGDVAVRLDRVFEMRLFGDDFDLHWVREGEMGRLAVLADDVKVAAVMEEANLVHFGLAMPEAGPARKVWWRDHRYLLWGRRSGDSGDGWTRLTAARIGGLWVPHEAGGADRIQIEAREYFGKERFGNVIFLRERLIGLRALAMHSDKA